MKNVYTITLEESPSPEDVQALEKGLIAYNRLFVPEDKFQHLRLFLRAADHSLVGGLLGETYWDWLHISILWVHENLRAQGYGTQLLTRAEQEAVQRGCHSVHLDTLSFQALPFYQRLGYSVFGILPDHPVGHRRYFLKKALLSAEDH